jgi:hypothetical protein
MVLCYGVDIPNRYGKRVSRAPSPASLSHQRAATSAGLIGVKVFSPMR